MLTKKNYKGQCFEVSFDKMFSTDYGLSFFLKPSEAVSDVLREFFGMDIDLHIRNVGCVIFLENTFKEDDGMACYVCDANSEDCFEIYNMIEKNQCVQHFLTKIIW